jgi:hypothetical protein
MDACNSEESQERRVWSDRDFLRRRECFDSTPLNIGSTRVKTCSIHVQDPLKTDRIVVEISEYTVQMIGIRGWMLGRIELEFMHVGKFHDVGFGGRSADMLRQGFSPIKRAETTRVLVMGANRYQIIDAKISVGWN